MDIDIRMAKERFKEFLPEGRKLDMITHHECFTCMDHLLVSYDGPKVPAFHEKLDKVLIRFGWQIQEETLDSTTKRMYIKLTRDSMISPSEQGKKLMEAREAKKTRTAGLRAIDI